MWKGPIEVEGKIKIILILTLRHNIANERTAVKVSEIGLEQDRPVSHGYSDRSYVAHLPRFVKVDILSSLTTRWTHPLDNGELISQVCADRVAWLTCLNVTLRLIKVSVSSSTSESDIGVRNSCGFRHLSSIASHTCAVFRTGSAPGGLMGNVCDWISTTIIASIRIVEIVVQAGTWGYGAVALGRRSEACVYAIQ